MEQQAINKSDLIGIRGYKEEDKTSFCPHSLGFYPVTAHYLRLRKKRVYEATTTQLQKTLYKRTKLE